MIGDTLCDFLKKYGKSENTFYKNEISNYETTFSDFLMNKGNEFEHHIVKFLKTKFKDDIVFVSDIYTVNDAKATLDLMKRGAPIIHSAPIFNKYDNTYGIIDLLVRSDYINKIFIDNILEPYEEIQKAPNLSGKYHYRVIDIKYSTLNLASDGIHLLNSKNYPAYKSQLFIYNEAISNLQQYNPNCAYILGRRWKYTSKGTTYSGNHSLQKPGIVDFFTYDESYPEKTYDAIDWYRDVLQNGVNWDISPPSSKELYPNMKIDSGRLNDAKNQIANNIGDITMIWNCGIKQRNKCLEQGITSWRDERCNSKLMGFKKESSRAKIVDNIININRQDTDLILPKKIKNNYNNWQRCVNNELYVDFETFNDICDNFNNIPRQPSFNYIFMIGIGRKIGGNWSYKSFICKEATPEEEKRIIMEFYQYYVDLFYPPVYFWCAENSFWERSCTKHHLNLTIDWIDMAKIFRKEPIVIKDCFNFSLKSIAKKMKKHGMINTVLESECNNGMMAMIKAWKCYNNFSNPDKSPIMKDIEKYNEFDCKALFDIMNFLRTNLI